MRQGENISPSEGEWCHYPACEVYQKGTADGWGRKIFSRY